MLTGRKEEQIKLLNAMESDESEFIAVYGRRRVGKTFLIRETFGYKFTFSHTGLAKKCTREQLANFQSSPEDRDSGRLRGRRAGFRHSICLWILLTVPMRSARLYSLMSSHGWMRRALVS